jgi:hypothetical protein
MEELGEGIEDAFQELPTGLRAHLAGSGNTPAAKSAIQLAIQSLRARLGQ